MRTFFDLALFAAFCTVLAPVNAAATGLCAEKIESGYVNIMMMNDVFGAGLDDVFDVVIQRVRPKTETELDQLKAFYYFEGKDGAGFAYPDGREYKWQLENNEYRLYKRVKGKDPERVEVYKAAFPADRKFLYQLRLLKSNPRVYRELGLDKKLSAVGLMGVVFRGGRGALEFINSVNMASGTDTPKLVIKNANTVLYRYALSAGFEGTARQVSYDEFHGTSGFKILMERTSEQEILDTYFGELMAAAGEAERFSTVDNFKDISLNPKSIDGLKAEEIKYVYVPCKAGGNDTYGSPKAAFLPVKIADDKGTSFYPVFVFPSAFSNLETLNKAIRRELYHARWWNAAANLPHQPADPDAVEDPSLKREAFLRQATPYIEMDIFESLKEDPPYAEYQQMFASLRLLLHDQLQSVVKHPEKLQFSFPWTVSPALIKPNGIYGPAIEDMVDDVGARHHNKVLAKVYKTMNDFTIRHNSPGTEKTKKELGESLVDSLVHGYSMTREKRNERLGMVTRYKPLFLGFLDGMEAYKPGWKWAGDRDKAFELINAVGEKGYGYSDLQWTFKVVQALWFNYEPFYKRFDYLLKSEKVSAITGLAAVQKKPFVITAEQEIADVKVLLDSLAGKGKKALRKVVDSTSLEADKKIAKQKEIEALNREIAILQNQHDEVVGQFVEAEKQYLAALHDHDAKTAEAYTSMTAQCTNSTGFEPARDMKGTYLYNQYLNVLDVKGEGCPSAIENFLTVRDNPDTGKNLETLHKTQSEKRSLYDTVMSLMDEAEARLYQADIDEKSMDTSLAASLKKINKSNKKVFKTWGDYAHAAFLDYFTGQGEDKAAFEALEGKLKVIPGVAVIKGGIQ